MNERTMLYQFERPRYIPEDFPKRERVFVLIDSLHNNRGPFRRLIECDQARYVLRIDYNESVDDCEENRCLNKVCEALAMDERELIFAAANECMMLFWSFLKIDYEMRLEQGFVGKVHNPFNIGGNSSFKIQLKTIDGLLCAMDHDTELDVSPKPFENPIGDIATYATSKIEFLERIVSNIFRVKVEEREYCLKTLTWKLESNLKLEIEKLHRIQGHRNIVELSGLVITEEGKVCGMLMPFISGITLDKVQSASKEMKEKWKEQIQEAVKFIHDAGVVWEDAKQHNIIVNNANNDLVLIDFEPGMADSLPINPYNSKERDCYNCRKIFSFLDTIPAN